MHGIRWSHHGIVQEVTLISDVLAAGNQLNLVRLIWLRKELEDQHMWFFLRRIILAAMGDTWKSSRRIKKVLRQLSAHSIRTNRAGKNLRTWQPITSSR